MKSRVLLDYKGLKDISRCGIGPPLVLNPKAKASTVLKGGFDMLRTAGVNPARVGEAWCEVSDWWKYQAGGGGVFRVELLCPPSAGSGNSA